MNAKYHWLGPETELVSGVHAHELLIESIESGIAGFEAFGEFTFCDYVEHGILGKDKWKANKQHPGLILAEEPINHGWVVEAVPDGGFTIFEPGCFTLSPEIDRQIHAFIGHHLNEHQEGERPRESHWDKPIEPFSGDCICAAGHVSNPPRLADRFPDRCFVCSCGTRHYDLGEPSMRSNLLLPFQQDWWPVPDNAAWEMLCQHNGVQRRAITVVDDNSRERGIYLLKTLVDDGLIPMGIVEPEIIALWLNEE